MHLEIQVALNFVISYLYNKLPRRRVNIFGEELEKALKDKFNGHWYPDKPFKGSAFRCLKTGDPIDAVLERAARESGVPITDILENLPNELSVWVDPGEVSYRIGEKGIIKILYSETNDNQEDNNSADREVNKTFNPEAQCFRPIDAVTSNMNNLSLSPKTSPLTGSSPLSATSISPTYKSSPNSNGPMMNGGGGSFMQRSQAPLTFTTATFAQTKFGSTKLKTSSKRANSSYRMSPTEFSNYIKQRAMQQQMHHNLSPVAVTSSANGGGGGGGVSNHFGPIGPVSPARSISPNPMGVNLTTTTTPNSGCNGIGTGTGNGNGNGNGNANGNGNINGNGVMESSYYTYPNMAAMGMYAQMNGHRNIYDTQHHYHGDSNGANTPAAAAAAAAVAAAAAAAAAGLYGGLSSTATGMGGKFNNFLDPHGYFNTSGHLTATQQQQQQQQQQSTTTGSAATTMTATAVNGNGLINTNNHLLAHANDLLQSATVGNLIDLNSSNGSLIVGHKTSVGQSHNISISSSNNNNNNGNTGKNIMTTTKSTVNITVTAAPQNVGELEMTMSPRVGNERQSNVVGTSAINKNDRDAEEEQDASVLDEVIPPPLTAITLNGNDMETSSNHENHSSNITTTRGNNNNNMNVMATIPTVSGEDDGAAVANSTNLPIVVVSNTGNSSSTPETNINNNTNTNTNTNTNSNSNGTTATNAVASNTKLMVDGLNAFYSSATGTAANYQQLLVAN